MKNSAQSFEITDFRTWPCSQGSCNGLESGGPVWFTALPSGHSASVWANCGNGAAGEYTLAVYSGVPESYTSLYGCDNVKIINSAIFNSLQEFSLVSAGLN